MKSSDFVPGAPEMEPEMEQARIKTNFILFKKNWKQANDFSVIIGESSISLRYNLFNSIGYTGCEMLNAVSAVLDEWINDNTWS